MITIDLAYDEKIAKELLDYMAELEIESVLVGTEIQTSHIGFDEKILGTFLAKTKRDKHVIQKIDKTYYLVSKMTKVEDLGLETCEICGLVTTKDKIFTHRWTHGA